MTMQYSFAVKTARAQALANKMDAAPTAAKILMYDGTKPAGLGAVTTQQLMVELVLQKPCATEVADGIIHLAPIDEQMVQVTSTVTWARIVDGSGNLIGDMLVGVSGSGADLTLPTANLVQGSYVRITAGQIQEG